MLLRPDLFRVRYDTVALLHFWCLFSCYTSQRNITPNEWTFQNTSRVLVYAFGRFRVQKLQTRVSVTKPRSQLSSTSSRSNSSPFTPSYHITTDPIIECCLCPIFVSFRYQSRRHSGGSCLKRTGRIRNAALYRTGTTLKGRVSSSFVLGAKYAKESRTAMKMPVLGIAAR